MLASMFGHLEVVRTLLEVKADVNAEDKVRNQLMMMIMMVMMMMMMMMMIVINVEDRDVCR
jgi:hypothetical protein